MTTTTIATTLVPENLLRCNEIINVKFQHGHASVTIAMIEYSGGKIAFFADYIGNHFCRMVCVPTQARGQHWDAFIREFREQYDSVDFYLLTGDDPTLQLH